ncbi:MAG: adenylate/guanylate cyclase domain-containing protein [Thermoguttaceae bacterium]
MSEQKKEDSGGLHQSVPEMIISAQKHLSVPVPNIVAGAGYGGYTSRHDRPNWINNLVAAASGSAGMSPGLAPPPSEVQMQLQSHIRTLQDELSTATKQGKENESLRRINDDLRATLGLQHLTTRVTQKAEADLLKSPSKLRSHFESNELCQAFVMSIDIRRSTELMLKARETDLFARFITDLCIELGTTITDSYGVFDKFTGDGILAFFPEFFSGPDAGFLAIRAADECHRVFERHYDRNRSCFVSVLKDTGLGIGIDYGKVKLTRVMEGLTVVGTPVVYACRMGGARARQTLLNQPAYEVVFDKFSGFCHFCETEIDFKHEGNTIAYAVSCNEKPYEPKEPDWLKKTKDEEKPDLAGEEKA